MTGYYAHYYVSFIFVPLAGVILPILAMGLLFNYVEN
ncbi:MAG: photosystem I reaction center subunit VIII [Pseudanabaena sp.]|uniref:Photosystem I reaction center subunit VIII n=1 Tax=Pseudanabaena frigida TaxID=945775 RepID=A0A2W4WCZ4_9CYAN|nr:MAG: photosystem I reaction center subunit VIII [Pseudanabaena frigida]